MDEEGPRRLKHLHCDTKHEKKKRQKCHQQKKKSPSNTEQIHTYRAFVRGECKTEKYLICMHRKVTGR